MDPASPKANRDQLQLINYLMKAVKKKTKKQRTGLERFAQPPTDEEMHRVQQENDRLSD